MSALQFQPPTTGLSTEALQKVIFRCHERGGGFVHIPPGHHTIGTIRLLTGVHLVLEPGAVLQGSQEIGDYAADVQGCIEAPSFSRCLIYAENARDIGLHGPGVIDGRGIRDIFRPSSQANAVPERPMLIRLQDCSDVRLAGITLRNAAAWCCHLVGCERVWIVDSVIDSRVNCNNDGLDLDSCRDVFIRGCRIHTGDDAICLKSTRAKQLSENILVSDCSITSDTAGVKLGTSSAGGFRHVLVQNCIFRDCGMGVLKILCVDGGLLEHVHFSHLQMDRVAGPIFIRLGNRGVVFDRPKEIVYDGDEVKEAALPQPGILRHCSFRHIRAHVQGDDETRNGILITGLPTARVEDLLFEDVTIQFPGGGTAEDAKWVVAEDERRYPERFFFGVLPASAVFLRHAEDVTFRRVRWILEKPDARPLIVTNQAEDVHYEDCRYRVLPGRAYQSLAPE